MLTDAAQRRHVLENLDEMVVKAVGESGGYGMLIGPQSTKQQREEFRVRIIADPRNSHCAAYSGAVLRAVLMDGEVESRHIDLRPYILMGGKVTLVPGGLTRVALRKGSLVGEFVAGRREQGYMGAARGERGQAAPRTDC